MTATHIVESPCEQNKIPVTVGCYIVVIMYIKEIAGLHKIYQWVNAILSLMPIQSIGTYDNIALTHRYGKMVLPCN